MTQEALKQMYQLLLTEPHAPTVCAQLERIAREALADHAMRETQRLGQEIEQEPMQFKCTVIDDAHPNGIPLEQWAKPPQRTERHELQAKGEHPAPCARHCEANAFQIVIKNLKAQLAQRKPLTEEAQVLRCLLGAALGALRYHTEQTRPIQRTTETIAAIEHEMAAHGIKGDA